jgi:hypothetical protein
MKRIFIFVLSFVIRAAMAHQAARFAYTAWRKS